LALIVAEMRVAGAVLPEDLRRLALQTMNQAIDRLLDKPRFQEALRL
jgi:hypothetical protein